MPDLLERLTLALADRYAVESEIGRGGMAAVFLAQDLQHHRQVAIKVLLPELTASLAAQRFLREIEIAARLDHPHIVALFDSGQAADILFYVMPYVEGESLRDRLERYGQLPIDEAIRIAREVTDGLAYAHEHGVVHRDVKPANILLSAGHARIADFGVAHAIGVAGEDRVTATGLAVGTPTYMSPEQASGQARGDERSDIYSVGCILYEMLVGEPPHSGSTPQVVQARKLTESAPRIQLIRDTVSPALEGVVANALARTPADRYQTAKALSEALSDPTTRVKAATARAKPHRRGRLWPIVTFAVLALILLGYGASTVGFGPGQAGDAPEIRSLVVLPLANLSGDPDQEYLAVGMTEALIAELGRLSDLRKVISRTTAMNYGETDKTLPEIADELGVDGVLEGSVLRAADDVLITLRLMHGHTDSEVWSGEYDEPLQDVFALRRRVTHAVADGINIALTPQEREHLREGGYAPDPRAYEAYLRGRNFFDQWDPIDASRAIAHYQDAIAIDTAFAAAHAALAEVCMMLPALGLNAESFDLGSCVDIVQTALDLDSGLAEAHSLLALDRIAQWEWEQAEASFKRAIELNPNAVVPHLWYGWFLSFELRLEESIREARRAEELDPRNLFAKTMVAQPLLNDHRYEEVLAQMDEVLAIDPKYTAAFVYQAAAHALRGDAQLAMESAQRAGDRWGPDDFRVLGLTGWSHALAGDEELALEKIARIEELYGEVGAPGFTATVFLALGREDEALDRLEKGYAAHIEYLPNMTSQPNFDGLREHPRFQELRRQMGLP